MISRTAAFGALALLPGLACGTDDAGVFNAGDSAEPTATADVADGVAPTGSEQASAGENAVSGDATTGNPAAFPADGEMVVNFSFTPTGQGRIQNPYIAVWVEDGDGNLVQTVSVWYQQSDKGTRWLKDLRAWYDISGGDSGTVTSGATRAAGDYSVVWDGTGLDGNAVAQGDYIVYVEAAREHGPYEISSATVTIGDQGGSWTMDDADELTSLSVDLLV